MGFHFHIRPIGDLDQGFHLTCEGVLPDSVHHPRLIQAVIHAVQVGSHLPGDIQVYDTSGAVAEVLPLRGEDFSQQFHQRAA